MVSFCLSIASQVLIDLLSTYTDSLALESEVIELVKDLVVMAISDPNRYIFNELLELEAVQSQQPEKIYQVRNLFSYTYMYMYTYISSPPPPPVIGNIC